jgi:hypothetical protein
MRRTLVPLLGLAFLLAPGAAPPASAGTVEVVIERVPTPDFEGFLTRQARYTADPGERNRVVVSSTRDGVRIEDPGKRLRPVGPHCVSAAPAAVECSWDGSMPPGVQAGLITANVRTLDGDDTIRADEAKPAQLLGEGGTGSDVLRGSATMGDDLDGGGGGRDRLYGGGNSDTLTDGDTTGDVDSDVLDGGTLTYQGRTGDVTVDLMRRRAGERGENDVLGPDFLAVYGGDGDDTLRGDAAYNHLDGGPGDDHLDGEGEADFMVGGAGYDRLHGDAGGDYLEGGPGPDQLRGDFGDDDLFTPDARDRLVCGPGDDVLSYPTQTLLVPLQCERLTFDLSPDQFPPGEGTVVTTPAHPASVAAGVATFAVACPVDTNDDDSYGCDGGSGSLLLRGAQRGPVFGAAGLRWTVDSSGRGQHILSGGRVRLSPAARRAAASRSGVLTSVAVRVFGADTARWTIRLRAR